MSFIDPDLATVDWDLVAKRIATQAGINAERVMGTTAANLQQQLDDDPNVTQSIEKLGQTIKDLGLTYEDGGYTPQGTDPETAIKTEISRTNNNDGTITVFYSDGSQELVADPMWKGKPKTEKEEPLTVINQMRDSFRLVLAGLGMSEQQVDDIWNWAVGKFTSDPSFTAARAEVEMYELDAFKQRFPAIGQMANPPTPAQYMSFERTIAQSFRKYGAGYASPGLITSLLINQVGTLEVDERLQEAERVMYSLPSEVRDTFNDWWGEEGAREITMSLFLDPNQNWSQLQDKIKTAEVGAWGQMAAGLDQGWDMNKANKIADLGLSQAQVWNTFANLKDKEALFAENIGEDRDLRYEVEGVEAEFGIGGSALELADILENRKDTRVARFSGAGGGGVMQGPQTGFGSAIA